MPPPQSPAYLQLPFSVPLKPLSLPRAATWSIDTWPITSPGGSCGKSASMSMPTKIPSPLAFLMVNPSTDTFEETIQIPFSSPAALIVA